jgi:flagellar biosynthesis GTPase FlhF
MRTRTIALVVAILLVAGFAALNWAEIVRPAPLLFGPVVADAPLGLILLGLLALTLVLFLASSAAIRTQSLMDYRHHQKTLEAQRELADKAEASRFTDLRQHLDTHLRDLKERAPMTAADFDRAMVQNRRDMQQQIEQMNRMMAARLNELEQRLDNRFERVGGAGAPARTDLAQPVAATTQPEPLARMQEDERRLEGERRMEDKPAETSGWRRWF